MIRNKKGDVAWGYIVAIIIGLIVLGLIFLLAMKTKNGLSESGEVLGGLFG